MFQIFIDKHRFKVYTKIHQEQTGRGLDMKKTGTEVGGTELLEMTGATKTQLNYWIRSGAIKPRKDVSGSGKRREYSHRNIIETAICLELNKFGLSPDVMKVALDYLREPCVWDTGDGVLFAGGIGSETYWQFMAKNPGERVLMAIDVGKGTLCVRIGDTDTFKSFLMRPLTSLILIDLAGIEMALGLRWFFLPHQV
jgi:DNA-binding transcriptional MerR regulator